MHRFGEQVFAPDHIGPGSISESFCRHQDTHQINLRRRKYIRSTSGIATFWSSFWAFSSDFWRFFYRKKQENRRRKSALTICLIFGIIWRLRAESNRHERLCSPIIILVIQLYTDIDTRIATPILPENSHHTPSCRQPFTMVMQTSDLWLCTTFPRSGGCTDRDSGLSILSDRCVRQWW